MRLNESWRHSERVFTVSVLASPGTPSSSTWPPVIRPISSRSIICRCPTITWPACASSASTNADSCWMRSLRRRMSVAGCALKLPFLCGAPRLSEPANGHKLPSFQTSDRLAGVLVATRATRLEQLAGLLRIRSALQEQIALPGAPVRESTLARPPEKEDGPHRVVGARVRVSEV